MVVPMILVKITLFSWLLIPIICFLTFKYARRKFRQAGAAKKMVAEQRSRNRSLSTKYGKMTEQFLPLVSTYPYDPSNFRFLGSPIDGVQFEDDKVVLVEFKTAGGKMTTRQKKIRELVRNRKVDFALVTIK